MDFLENEVKLTSRILTPPLIIRCDKCTQTDSPTLHFQPLGKRPMEQSNKRLISREFLRNIILLVPNHHHLLTLDNDGFIFQPVNKIVVNK
ncbi:hypothetical protein TNIN_2171 [Trichonephila inaurata madagascariensis]|uniref:Uncharacterized protein n=1 Tax=Trichonephila inaurata madagascariensis TaxID=2747483 RepID=A0A8X6IJ56_9ARAC|nr:hypothetical protein TNIN_139091 [Trichonephila inaurata madagascariensis]GFY37271.1 hypothetical protein TNIN_2171 [Trichonephila inaurata madagascariensis]